jgi:hypothetical protein
VTRDTTLDRNTDHHLPIVQPPRCECPDCYEHIYYLDPECRWWCVNHSKQAIFVALGAEYGYPKIIFTNSALTQFAGIEGGDQWYSLARAARYHPAALEGAIFDILAQLKLISRPLVEECACVFGTVPCTNPVGAVGGLCAGCASGDHMGHRGRGKSW